MKNIAILIIVLCGAVGLTAQSCLPSGIYFSSQTEIDNFKLNHPGCTEIEGSVEIDGASITNLDSLHQITSIGGYLEIYSIPDLVSIEGLGALTSIGTGRLAIHGTALTNLHGLENLITIPGLRIEGNPVLNSLEGLNNLTSSSGGVYILENPLLTSIQGLESLTFTGEGGYLVIEYNESLSSLSGLDNIIFNALYVTEIWINNNPLLSVCEVESICNFLNNEGIIYVNENAEGCNTIDEVRSACGTSVSEHNYPYVMKLYPNPTQSTITIELPTHPTKNTSLTISNTNGQQLITQAIAEPQTEIDISHLPAGIYIVKVWNDKEVMVRKVIKK